MPRYLNTKGDRPVASMKRENCKRAAIFEDNDRLAQAFVALAGDFVDFKPLSPHILQHKKGEACGQAK